MPAKARVVPLRRRFLLRWPACFSVLESRMRSVDPIIFAGTETLSLRQLDELNNVPKGTSFRWFKACDTELVEGKDYYYLPADSHAELIEQLREAGQIYASTRHLLLLTRNGYQHIHARSQR